MENTENLKDQIAASSWSALQKKQITQILPNLGERVLAFLEDRLGRSDFGLVSMEIYVSVFDGNEALADLQTGKADNFVSFLKRAQNSDDYNNGIYLIPMVLDLKQLLRQGKINAPKELLEAIGEFELNLFSDLPEDELKTLLGENLLYFMRRLDVLRQFKILFLNKGTFDAEAWGRECWTALEGNKQLLSQRTISVDNRQVEPSVQNWIKDALSSSPKGPAGQSSFSEVQYVQKSRNVASLTIEEKKLLIDILKLHKWFLHPTASIEDLEGGQIEHERKIEIPRPEPSAAARLRPSAGLVQKPSPTSPGLQLPKAGGNLTKDNPFANVPEQKPKEEFRIHSGKEQVIDRKLEELKSRLKK